MDLCCRFYVFAILAVQGSTTKVQYNGDQVLKVIPLTANHADFLQDISNQLQLDLWKPRMPEAIIPGTEVHVRVPVSLLQNLKEQFQQREISFEVIISDVQKLTGQRTMTAHRKPYMSLADFDYTIYHPMHEIYDWMVQIREKYSDVVTLHYLGPTYEERPMFYFKIGWPSDQKKKIIWIDCGIHAREWIAVAFCQWFIKEILENQNSDPIITKALRNIDFYVVPVLNIDGFIYSWTKDRLWRKNRAPYNNGTCYGVDLNRNFDAKWCSVGASHNCRDLTFCGSGPKSEAETIAVSNLVESIKSDILCFLTIHSYSQLILLPYGYTKDPSQNHNEMLTVAQKAAEKLKEKYGTPYRVGSSADILYNTSGSSRDWATDLGINLVYTFELRDNGTYGFELPENQIKPTCEETTDAILSIVDYVNEKYFNSATSIFCAGLWINLCFSFVIATYDSLF